MSVCVCGEAKAKIHNGRWWYVWRENTRESSRKLLLLIANGGGRVSELMCVNVEEEEMRVIFASRISYVNVCCVESLVCVFLSVQNGVCFVYCSVVRSLNIYIYTGLELLFVLKTKLFVCFYVNSMLLSASSTLALLFRCIKQQTILVVWKKRVRNILFVCFAIFAKKCVINY